MSLGDRFYQQQIDATGSCPGLKNTTKRKRRMAWDDAKKEKAVEMYENAEPTPENSMEIVKDIAEDLDESPNGVRMILTKAGVYVKKAAASKSAASGGTPSASTRVSKADAIEALSVAIRDAGHEVDEEIVSKLTGKAAQYFTTLLASN
jgi:hypothetical protein|tara:strand:- start:322 stop:768 length:447 start_codon:yes stop_codon:yes gene_type:complete